MYVESVFSAAATLRSHRRGGRRGIGRWRLLSLRSPCRRSPSRAGKTGGKHADTINKATGKARDALDSLDGKNDDIGPGSAKTHGDPLRPETTDPNQG